MISHKLRNQIASLSRWLHIYVSMLGLGAVLFFSITGITLNHPAWFGEPVEKEITGTMNPAWLSTEEDRVAKLEVVEFLRAQHALHGTVDEFRVEDDECSVIFHGPGSSAEATIAISSGAYTLHTSDEGWMAYANDLHKGRNTGAAWSWLIDLVAGLLVIISLSGLLLLFFIKKRRTKGFLLATIAVVLLVIFARYFIP